MRNSDTGVAVRRIKHNGKNYGGSASKPSRGKPVVAPGAVVVLSLDLEKRNLLGRRGVKQKKESRDAFRVEWKDYANSRDGIVRRKEVSQMLDVVRRRKNTFHRLLVERFAIAVRKHFDQHSIGQCPFTVVAKGRYPLHPDAGMFYRVRVSGSDELFQVPKEFLP